MARVSPIKLSDIHLLTLHSYSHCLLRTHGYIHIVTFLFSFLGYLSNYGGDGYVFELRGDADVLINRTIQLEKEAWVDRYTRVILAEFTVYNPGTNLFAICTMLLEKPESGSFHPTWR